MLFRLSSVSTVVPTRLLPLHPQIGQLLKLERVVHIRRKNMGRERETRAARPCLLDVPRFMDGTHPDPNYVFPSTTHLSQDCYRGG